MVDKCPKCGTEMEIFQDAYAHKDGIIVLHEVERCPECGATILTEEQMDEFVKKLKQLNLWKEEYGIVKIRKDLPEFKKLV
ncbi:MAG: YgiT-type zinc finger protein [Methanosarcinales archaeon]